VKVLDLRNYQRETVDNALAFLRSAVRGERRLYVAPCGTGKSFIEIAIQQAIPGSVILTPRVEIRDGMIAKGGDGDRISTPITYRNRLMEGRFSPPSALIIDEAHHDTCDTGEQVRLCADDPCTVAFTATPFRGTPQGTAELRALYGQPHYILTLPDAVSCGVCVIPECYTEPILDDDVVEIINGEFQITSVNGKTDWPRAADLVCKVWADPQPTVVALSSVRAMQILAAELDRRGIPHACVTAQTSRKDRELAFKQCEYPSTVLLQIQVVSEGVDLQVRNLIDLAPTMSPVRWLQQVGRAMRPGGTSYYACCNRNLLRHGYLFEGLLPHNVFRDAQHAFPQPSRRNYMRAFGLEGVGKLKPAPVPLSNGLQATAYYVTRTVAHIATQYCAIVLPDKPRVLWARRENVYDGDTSYYGRWVECGAPTDLKGFASKQRIILSPKQVAWWQRDARRYGLDETVKVDAKTFAVLPVLAGLGKRIN